MHRPPSAGQPRDNFRCYGPGAMGRRVKVVLLGDSGVGKTCLYTALSSGVFPRNTPPTIGGTFARLEDIRGNTTYHIDLWDTAGQESARMLVPLYLAGAELVILCFDMGGDRAGLERIQYWMNIARESRAGPRVRVVIAGCKSDLESKFTSDDLVAIGQRLHVGQIVQTSARTGEGIEALWTTMFSEIEMCSPNEPVLPEITMRSPRKCC